ncbi:MAG: family 78 glycoside hydrolase catalytic domain, partial [Propionibacteriaceae bacterium]|nr:family 78 glycoside hydrolase catalytic domain [Propionibacteriaceae bacterium]
MSTHVDSVRLESARELTHVPCPRPRLTWVVATDVSGWHQLEAEVVWTDGSGDQAVRLQSSESVNVAWPFPGLPPRGQGQLKVRVRGEDGWSGFSATYDVAAAFLGGGEWQAEFVGLGDPARRAQPVLVRHEFDVPAGLTRATWYATALGVYEAWFNGRPVDDEVLKPGWTPYQFRRVLQTVDVTARLEPGRNAVGVAVAGGWYAEQFGFHGLARTVYGDQPLFAGQLLLEFADGSQTWVRSGQGWRATGEGPWVAAGLYAGETYDARRWPAGWTRAGYDDAAWTPVRVEAAAIGAHPAPVPAARTTPAARVTRRVPVAQVLTSPAGKLLLDFGQNLVGRLRIRVTGEAGTTITLRHAEVLEAGELGVRTLRFAAATDTYVLAGGGVEDWAPAFTFHGFRYAEVTGWPGELDAGDIVAEVVHQDMARTGWFDCSDPLVARLHENVVWGMRGNFLYLPTDCPQRDERLGWTGDIQVFGPTASYLFDCDTFLASWLKDLALEQAAAGGVPFVVPDVLDSGQVPATGWGDVAVLLPWVLFQRFADVKVLADQYESMQAWVDQILALAGSRYLWEGGFQFGDWVDPDSPPDQPGKSKVSPDLVASAYLYHTTSVFAQIARRLGRSEAERYGDVAARIRTAWLAEYVTPAGRAMSDVQT